MSDPEKPTHFPSLRREQPRLGLMEQRYSLKHGGRKNIREAANARGKLDALSDIKNDEVLWVKKERKDKAAEEFDRWWRSLSDHFEHPELLDELFDVDEIRFEYVDTYTRAYKLNIDWEVQSGRIKKPNSTATSTATQTPVNGPSARITNSKELDDGQLYKVEITDPHRLQAPVNIEVVITDEGEVGIREPWGDD